MTLRVLTRRRTATAWGFESCAIEHSSSAARANSKLTRVKGPPFAAVCRWKRSLLFKNLMNATTVTEKKSSVVVVEDHPVLCDGLKQLISSQPDLACIGVADDVSGAKRLVQECEPDLMVLDLRLKGGDTLDFIKTLRAEFPEVKVLVLSQYENHQI